VAGFCSGESITTQYFHAELLMTTHSNSYVQFIRDLNKHLTEQVQKLSKERQRLQEENWQLKDEINSWEHASELRRWGQSTESRS
jgi:predicted RNase H-like nuclease (RuvC/YqgF family)